MQWYYNVLLLLLLALQPTMGFSLLSDSLPFYSFFNLLFPPSGIIILWDHRRICSPSLTETSLCGAYLYFDGAALGFFPLCYTANCCAWTWASVFWRPGIHRMTSQSGRTLTLACAESVECGFNEMCHARCLIIAFYLGMAVHSAKGIAL